MTLDSKVKVEYTYNPFHGSTKSSLLFIKSVHIWHTAYLRCVEDNADFIENNHYKNTYQSGPPSSRQRNAILMAFRWWVVVQVVIKGQRL